MSFRENLLYLRATHNMTQEQLAEKLGVSRQSVTKWEADKSYPEMDKLIKLSQLFDCTLDELVQGDLTNREAQLIDATDNATYKAEAEFESPSEAAAQTTNDAASETAFTPTPTAIFKVSNNGSKDNDQATTHEDEFGYDKHIRSFANRISSGVLLVLLGVAIGNVFFGLCGHEGGIPLLPENIADALGTLCILAGVVMGVASFVPAGLEHADFVKKHPNLKDFYTDEKRVEIRNSFVYGLIGGCVLIFIGVIVCIAFSNSPVENVVGVPVMLALVAVGSQSIVKNSIVYGMSNIESYNIAAAEARKERESAQKCVREGEGYSKSGMPKQSNTEKRIGAICGAIMILATIGGLVMLFIPDYQSPLFWMSWVIGGLLCGLVATLAKAFGRQED